MDADLQRQRQRKRIKNGSGATIQDVSQAAGVSTATVSRILNNPELVSPATRQAVDAAIRRLGYQPNAAARALAARRSYTIGAVVPSISNLLYGIMLDAFKKVLDQSNYDLMLSSFDYMPGAVARRVDKFVQRGVDAVFIASVEPEPEVARLLNDRNIPFMTTWLGSDDLPAPRIVYDHLAAAAKPASHLHELGHRRFAILTGPLNRNRRLRQRHDAIVANLAARGVSRTDVATVEVAAYDFKNARESFRGLLRRRNGETAIVASNDILAAGVILECHAQGIAVPDELSVTGFGDMDIAAHFHPPITTIRTPRANVGSLAAEYLIAKLNGADPQQEVLLDFELIVRETTGVQNVGDAFQIDV